MFFHKIIIGELVNNLKKDTFNRCNYGKRNNALEGQNYLWSDVTVMGLIFIAIGITWWKLKKNQHML